MQCVLPCLARISLRRVVVASSIPDPSWVILDSLLHFEGRVESFPWSEVRSPFNIALRGHCGPLARTNRKFIHIGRRLQINSLYVRL